MIKLKIKRIPSAGGLLPSMPRYATKGAAAADLHANVDEPVTIAPKSMGKVPTGIAIELPSAEYGAFVFARSGLAIKSGITLSNGVGVIDSDYRGEICVGLFNQSDKPYTINHGDRIAQLCILPVVLFEAFECQTLEDTVRGAGGLGSTGK